MHHKVDKIVSHNPALFDGNTCAFRLAARIAALPLAMHWSVSLDGI
jgi:hypothetical protein